MLSVGNRDERKGLGFDVGEMEENELEEGEACYYQDDDATIDPDVALSSLSYIDEKIQHVLGHFQKDFEGGVSAENLGAKFGGYGSFLPAYQRSPSVLCHPKSPQKVQTYGTPKSPNNLPLEGGQNRPILASGSHSVGLTSVSTNVQSSSIMPYMDNSSKKGYTPKHETVNNRSVNATEQKMLKLRIKVGSNNVSARKNAAIYSGLGLISPSSSLEDSPDGSDGFSPENCAPDESPMTILQNMTSFPIPGESLLSPLPDYVLRITEKENPLLKGSRPVTIQKCSQAMPTMLADEPRTVRDTKGFGEKKTKSAEKNGRHTDLQSANDKDSGSDMSDLLKKEIDIETPAGRELVSNALKLPLLSNSKAITEKLERPINIDTVRGSYRVSDFSRECNKGVLKDRASSSDLVKEEVFESLTSLDPNNVNKLGNEAVLLKEKHNLKLSSADKVWEDKKTNSHKEISFYLRKDGGGKGEQSFNTCNVDSNGIKGRSDRNSGSMERPEQKATQKATSYEQDTVKTSRRKEGKKKMKGNQSNDTPAMEECRRVSSSVATKDKKSSQAPDFSENRSDAMKSHKESSKTISRECHRDSLGDIKVQLVDNRIDSMEMSFKDKLKGSKLDSEKETHAFVKKSKEGSVAKKVEKPSTSEAYANAPAAALLTANGPITDAFITPAVPVVIKENWVCCDKCFKWRLLPYGTDSDLFEGKKWLCSMLNWLRPGMNKCTISEEETTKALNALYPVPVPESQNCAQGQYDGAASGKASTDVRHPDQSHELGSLAMPSTGRKKNGPKDTSNALGDTTLTHPPNSIKRNQRFSVKSGSLTDVNQYLLESNSANKVAIPDTSKSTDFAMEKHRCKQKEKHKLLERYSDGGDYMQQSGKHSKTKSKREADHDSGFTTSKKIKTEGAHYTEDLQSDFDVTRKEIPNLSNELLAKVTGKDHQKHNGYSSSMDSKGDARDNLLSSRKKPKSQFQVTLDGESKTQFEASDMGRSDKMDFAAKKRKLKEWQQSQGYPEAPSSGSIPVSAKDEISESELRREKKVRPSKFDGKESNTSKVDGRIEKKGGVTKILLSGSRDPPVNGMEEEIRGGNKNQNQGNLVSQPTRDGIDLSKREPGYAAQISTAATSSSSKVSGSRKSKANFRETKDSPVESVSSSPLRGSNADKLTTARKNILGTDDPTNLGFSVVGSSSPRRCSDGEGNGGSDRSGTVRKEKTFTAQHGSLESQRAADSSLLYEYQDRGGNQVPSSKPKNRMTSGGTDSNRSYAFENINIVNGGANTLVQHNPHLNEEQGKDHDHDPEKPNDNYHINGSGQRKLGKSSSSLSRDEHKSAKSNFDKDNLKVSDSCSEQEELYPMKSAGPVGSCRHEAGIGSLDLSPYHEDLRDGRYNIQEKHSVKADKDEKNYLGKKDSTAKWPSEGRRYSQSNPIVPGSPFQIKQHTDLNSRGGKSSAVCSKDGKFNPQQNLPQAMSREDERSSDPFLSNRTDRAEIASGRGKSQSFPPSGDKRESEGQCSLAIPTHHKGSMPDVLPVDGSGDDALRVPKQPNGGYHSNLRNPTPNGIVGRDLEAPSPLIRDHVQAAAKVLKEAKDLKHSANRLKRGGGELDSTNLYFRAALKFLHGASLLEPCNAESAKNGETTQSMKYYIDTASLCEFCAHGYEKCKEMAAAALAYKCVEVAYMRVIYSKHTCASKDQCKLQKALQTIPPGESPSSSASDVYDINNQATLDKVALGKGINSPQIVGDHVIPARGRPNYTRMLNYVQNMNSAMEASKKSQNAFAAANVGLKEARYGPEDIASVRSVLDFNFHDVEGLIHLVRLAMEAIGC